MDQYPAKHYDAELIELMEMCTLCSDHEISQNSYTAPAFMDCTDKLLTIEDIPVEYHKTNLNMDPKKNQWEDHVKNFFLDINSVDTQSKFSTCIVLTDVDPWYESSTMHLLWRKYGTKNSSMIYVYPKDEECDTFMMIIRRNDKIELKSEIDKDCLVGDLTMWYNAKSTLIYCHTTNMQQYRDVISMMPDSVWSVFCTSVNFVENKQSSDIKQAIKGSDKCTYVCPIYSHRASTETRAVGSGPIKFMAQKSITSYIGSMNYYSTHIRSLRHSSGRCYDCQMLYSFLIKMDMFREQQRTTPNVSFVSTFLESAKRKQNKDA